MQMQILFVSFWLKLSSSRCLNLKQVVCLNVVLCTVSLYVKKIPKSQSDFHFKRILRERQRSCHRKTYFNFNSWVVLRIYLVHSKHSSIWRNWSAFVDYKNKIEASISYLLAIKIQYILDMQLFAKGWKTARKNIKSKTQCGPLRKQWSWLIFLQREDFSTTFTDGSSIES